MKFSEIIEAVNEDNLNLSVVSSYHIDDAIKTTDGSYGFTSSKLSAEQVKQLAIAMIRNTHVTNIVTGYPSDYGIYSKRTTPPEIIPYLALIDSCVKRNLYSSQIKESNFVDYLKSDLSSFIMRPLVIIADFTKELFSNTFGLRPLMKRLEKVRFGHYDISLATISFSMQQRDRFYRHVTQDYSRYAVIGISKNQYVGSYLSAPLVPINYFFRNLGKLIGVALTLPFIPFLAVGAIGKSIVNRIKDKTVLDRSLISSTNEVQTRLEQVIPLAINDVNKDNVHSIVNILDNLQRLPSEERKSALQELNSKFENLLETREANYTLGEIFRDRMDFQKAYLAFKNVPSSDTNYVEAMYEASCIALHQLDKPKEETKQLLENGLKAANSKEDKIMSAQFEEMLSLLVVNDDDIISIDSKTDRKNVSPAWNKTPPATNYKTIRGNSVEAKKEEEESAKLLSKTIGRQL